jgi:hypothetical protein
LADIPAAVETHYRHVLKWQVTAIGLGSQAWAEVTPNAISESWLTQLPAVATAFEKLRRSVAVDSAIYTPLALAEQDSYQATDGFVDVDAFMPTLATGGPLEDALYVPAIRAKEAIGRGVGVSESLEVGKQALYGVLTSALADTGRQVGGVTVAARPNVGYTRMLNPPSCERCVVLAGRFYRWNTGFLRHPRCDCVHVPTGVKSTAAARAEGLVDDPYEYFNSLSEAEQDKVFGKAYAQAVRDGSDIFQVVNSKRGRLKHGLFTTEGTTRRGYAGAKLKRGQKRLTPEGIYRLAGRENLTREQTLSLLEQHGYLLPGGQNPTGSIRGQAQGFGAMGRGVTRRKASNAVLEANASGVRDGSVYTMTEAERRLAYAKRDYEETLHGLNPYTEAAIQRRQGVRAWSVDRPLTDSDRARAESWYQAMQATGGQLYLADGTDVRSLYKNLRGLG